jgi:hypothetical protein
VLEAVADVRLEDLLPRLAAGRVAGLRGVADQRHRPGGAATHQQPPRHLRELLRLVDDDVPERPGPIGGGPFRGAAVVRLLLAFGHPLGVDDVVRGEDLRFLVVLVLELVRP